MFEYHELRNGDTAYISSQEDFNHLRDHVLGLIEQLYLTKSPDMSLVNFNLDEIASLLEIKYT